MSQEPNVKSFPVTDAKGVAARITVSTDIVDYMASARVFGQEDLAQPGAHGRFQKRMIAIPDRRTSVVAPMVLSIGSNNGLYLVQRQEGSGEGWTRSDLAGSFSKFGLESVQVRALGAAWSDDDRIAVAVAVDSGDASGASRVFVAFDHSSKSDWEKVAWVDCGTRESIRVHGIRVLRELDGSWTVVLDGDAQRVDMLYLIRSTEEPSFAKALVFNPAVDYQEILDFEVAVDEISGSGVAVLGVSGKTRVLSFRPFPNFSSPQPSAPPVIPLPCPEGANVIESGVTREKGTDLYIGGKGIHLLPATEFYEQDDAKLTTVQAASDAPEREAQEIVVADSGDGAAAIWSRRANGELVFVNRAAGADGWSTPLRLRDGVQAIAAVPGGGLVTTSLLAVYTDGRSAFLMRDAAAGTWRESPLLVGNPKSVVKATCYGTAVRVLDDGHAPRVKLPVKVSASVLASISVNGQNVFIGPGLEFPVETDHQGAVHIYDRVRSLTPAVYRLTFDGIPGSVDVNPAGGIYERFSKMTADELRDAKAPRAGGGEEPLLPAEFQKGGARANEVDGVAGALRQAASLGSGSANVTTTGARLVTAGASFSSRLDLGTVADGYRWGIQAGPDGVRQASAAVMDSLAAAGQTVGQFFADLGDSLADFFEGFKTRLQEGWTFIVRKAGEAYEFICAIGNQIKKFVLQTLEQIGSFFTWLWSEIKTGLEKVWEFLKFVFNWDDILMARDVLVSVVGEGLNYMKASTKTLREKSVEGFNSAIGQVDLWRKEIGLPRAKLKPPPKGESFADSSREAGADAQTKVDQSTGNSVTGWIFEKIDDLFDQIIHIEGPKPGDIAFHAVRTFTSGVVKDQLQNLMNTWEQIQADIKELFDDKMPGVNDLNFETIKNLFVALGSNVVIGILTSLRDLAARAIDLLGEMVEVIRAALFAKVSFPFIEKLVELVAPGTNLDTSFRAVDALMLLVAVPATITYKLIFGEAPFKKGDAVNFPFGRVAVQELTIDEMKTFAVGMVPFVGIGVQFIKTVIGYYFMGEAMGGKFEFSNKGIVLGLIFGGLGVIAQAVSVRWNEGSAVTGLEWACYGASALAFLVTVGLTDKKWDNPGNSVTPTAHRIEAVFHIFLNLTQVVMGAVVFGFVASNVVNGKTAYNRHRILPETFSWVASLLDTAGSITTSSANFVSVDPAKTILIGASAIGKTTATAFKVLEVVAMKTITEKFATATA
jgi:hypothetical protein